LSRIQFGVADILLAMAALGLWGTVVYVVSESPLVGPGTVVLSLAGITVALYWLVRGNRHAWPVAAFLAPLIAGFCLLVAWIVENNN